MRKLWIDLEAFGRSPLAALEEVVATGSSCVITRHGVAVAELRPLAGSLRGSVAVLGDLTQPAVAPGDWEGSD